MVKEDEKTKFETFAEMYVKDMENVYLKSLKTKTQVSSFLQK